MCGHRRGVGVCPCVESCGDVFLETAESGAFDLRMWKFDGWVVLCCYFAERASSSWVGVGIESHWIRLSSLDDSCKFLAEAKADQEVEGTDCGVGGFQGAALCFLCGWYVLLHGRHVGSCVLCESHNFRLRGIRELNEPSLDLLEKIGLASTAKTQLHSSSLSMALV